MPPHNSPYKSTGGFKRVLVAMRYSWQGLVAACRHEAAFRQELALLVLLVPIAWWVSRSVGELLLLLGVVVLVLIVELLNSAIEAVADAVTLEHHPLIGRAKDLGSAAVFLAISLAVVVWLAVVLFRLFSLSS